MSKARTKVTAENAIYTLRCPVLMHAQDFTSGSPTLCSLLGYHKWCLWIRCSYKMNYRYRTAKAIRQYWLGLCTNHSRLLVVSSTKSGHFPIIPVTLLSVSMALSEDRHHCCCMNIWHDQVESLCIRVTASYFSRWLTTLSLYFGL